MKKCFLGVLFVFIVLISCTNKEKLKTPLQVKHPAKSFSMPWQNWQIQKGALGPLKLGSRISDYKKFLNGLDSLPVDAYLYKYGGGGVAYEYSYNKNQLFVLMPAIDTDSIIAIMALHPDFKTRYGTYPGNTAAQIFNRHKKLPVILDLLSGGEAMIDKVNRMNYIFDTPDDTPIAEYPNIDNPGVLKRSNVRCNWIVIY